jgi:hypothetical protein
VLARLQRAHHLVRVRGQAGDEVHRVHGRVGQHRIQVRVDALDTETARDPGGQIGPQVGDSGAGHPRVVGIDGHEFGPELQPDHDHSHEEKLFLLAGVVSMRPGPTGAGDAP